MASLVDTHVTMAPTTIVTSPAQAEPVSQISCGVCRRQFSKYTCSRCNLPYCSLPCYRSEKHADCSEAFYRREVESDIRTTPSKTQDERRQMMELLHRFEETDIKEPSGEEEREGDSDSDDDLAERLASVDLDSASYEEIWQMLSEDEKKRFVHALRDPGSELTQQLLASDEMEQSMIEPWWMTSKDSVSAHPNNHLTNANSGSRPRFGQRPDHAEIPNELCEKATVATALRLVYNMASICLAYTFVTRQVSTSPLSSLPTDSLETKEACRMMGKLVPFLVDHRSQTMHEDLSSVVTDVYGRLEQDSRTEELLAVLLDDAATLCYPSIVTELDDGKATSVTQSSACQHLLLCFSDLHDLFAREQGDPGKHSVGVTKKLLFYAAHALKIPTPIWQGLAQQLTLRSEHERRMSRQSAT